MVALRELIVLLSTAVAGLLTYNAKLLEPNISPRRVNSFCCATSWCDQAFMLVSDYMEVVRDQKTCKTTH